MRGSFNNHYPSAPPLAVHITVNNYNSHPHYSHLATTSFFENKPTVRVFCKAGPNFSLSIRDGLVILAPADPSDAYQHWYKVERYSTRVKDEEGYPAFLLVNKATGEAMKHSMADCNPVRLVLYNPEYLDESIMWTEGRDLGDCYRAIRMANNIHLNMDASKGIVQDGTVVILWTWNDGDNQKWKLVPYYEVEESAIDPEQSLMGRLNRLELNMQARFDAQQQDLEDLSQRFDDHAKQMLTILQYLR